MYKFVTYDIENQLQLDDKVITMILNSRSTETGISEELKALFEYINSNEVDSDDSFLFVENTGLTKEEVKKL